MALIVDEFKFVITLGTIYNYVYYTLNVLKFSWIGRGYSLVELETEVLSKPIEVTARLTYIQQVTGLDLNQDIKYSGCYILWCSSVCLHKFQDNV
jgi:hypothetical protein